MGGSFPLGNICSQRADIEGRRCSTDAKTLIDGEEYLFVGYRGEELLCFIGRAYKRGRGLQIVSTRDRRPELGRFEIHEAFLVSELSELDAGTAR